jgi:hypothetical protein
VAGGYLMAASWFFAAQAALAAVRRRKPLGPGSEPGASPWLAVALLAGLAVAAAVGATRLPELVDYARGHTAFAVVAAATAALGVALVAAAALSSEGLRQQHGEDRHLRAE